MGMIEGQLTKDGKPARKCGRPRIHPPKPPKDPNRPPHGKGVPKGGKGAKGILRPQVWITGEDPYLHTLYRAWQLSKAQYDFRYRHGLDPGKWLITFEEYCDLWEGNWHNRGRRSDDLCHSRLDWDSDWTRDNMIVITRNEHHKRENQLSKGKRIKGGRMTIVQAKIEAQGTSTKQWRKK